MASAMIYAAVLATAVSMAQAAENEFVFSLDLFASDTGYYKVEGYEGVQPQLTMKLGVEYTFIQKHYTNWYHPLGFAYLPDGAHEGADELEPGVGNGDEPHYHIDGQLSDLDTYESQFAYPRDFWLEKTYVVKLTVNDPNVKEVFYFCHIHNQMSGKILIEGHSSTAAVKALYTPKVISDFDKRCGTYNVVDYSSSAAEDKCPGEEFFCAETQSQFVDCMKAIDCKMNYEMKILHKSNSDPIATFIYQMIPHHDNAVNMAKILLKTVTDLETSDPDMWAMMYDIINAQNAQITFMNSWLMEKGLMDHPDSVKECRATIDAAAAAKDAGKTSAASSPAAMAAGAIVAAAVMALML